MPHSKLRKRNLQLSGTSSQTGPGDSEIQPLDVLHSEISQYKLQHFLFAGCFSKVAKCKHRETKEVTAIKIFKKRADGSQERNRELAMLDRIRGLDPDNIVRFIEGFEHKGHTCLAFEMLDKTLHELLRERRGNPLSLQEIRPITQQLLTALRSLKTVGVIHTNIKPHNIMLVNQKDQPFRVKVIDFSSAIAAAKVERGVIMQPVAYRSPDVILGLPISGAVDVWSLGGVLATMYLGSLLFPQRCQYYLMKTMVETLGQPEDELLNDGTHTLLYFSPSQDSTKPAWRLKTADEHKAATGFPPQKHRGSPTRFVRLDDLVMLHPEENSEDKIKFVSLLHKMLHLNPHKRITPGEALIHPFITQREVDDDENSPMVELAEDVNTSVAYNHSDDEPIDDGDSAPVDTADRASAIMSSTHDTSIAPVMAGVSDVPAGDEASKSTAGSADDTGSADETESESVEAESIDAGPQVELSAPSCSSVETPPAGGDSDAGCSYNHATDAAAGSAESDEDAVSSSDSEAPSAPLLFDSSDTSTDSDRVSATGSRNTRSKRIRRFFCRTFRALCCCCSASVKE